MFVYLCIQIALHVTRDIWSSCGQLVGLLEDLLSCLCICVSLLYVFCDPMNIYCLVSSFWYKLPNLVSFLVKWFCFRPWYSGYVPVYHAPVADWVTSLLRFCAVVPTALPSSAEEGHSLSPVTCR